LNAASAVRACGDQVEVLAIIQADVENVIELACQQRNLIVQLNDDLILKYSFKTEATLQSDDFA